MNSCAPASWAAAITRSIGMVLSTSAMFSRTERLNRMFSCSTTPICRRSQAGSTGAGRPDDADHLAGLNRQRDAAQRLGRIGTVAEPDPVEGHAALDRGQAGP